ncbi:glycosyltransferase family 2 protein [Sphingomonas sp. RB56-2]|uniref:Glycosyltransferase family 2 protein n=1 Tax=Sphingomonas brevis TaxID=2908206 RepID=A0ABT0SB89_9SPHN|nr:glycosyltransferase family 2 protein [Sphingomonas brevis]MCL6741397.1 glycosyltransferase family 2 protein [Sphingomonas brevis]
MKGSRAPYRIAVVIPCFNVGQTIATVVETIPGDIWRIYCVDDCSRDDTQSVITHFSKTDSRIRGIWRERNGGVGAAFMDGLTKAIGDGAEIIVKVDGDGQMNGAFVNEFAAPIVEGEADYVKGNRFFDIERVLAMPRIRLVGNAGLSFLSKLSTGYWNLFDPTNGYIAIHSDIARLIPAHKVHQRYFFESDLLFRLAILRAKVVELPLETVYEGEASHLNTWRCLITFPFLHFRNFFKRLIYNYVVRNFSVGSIALPTGLLLVLSGVIYGVIKWLDSFRTGDPATAGTVMLSALPVLVGIQFILSFLAHDVASVPDAPIHNRLNHKKTIVTPERKARNK